MKMNCPYCGEICETESDLQEGQHVVCPFCGEKFVYVRAASESVDELESRTIKSICPFCGTVENVDQKYLGYICTCANCKREFKVGDPRWRKRSSIAAPGGGLNQALTVVLFTFMALVLGGVLYCFSPEISRGYKNWRKKVALDKIQRTIPRQYTEAKQWYEHQLEYNGLAEGKFTGEWGGGNFTLQLLVKANLELVDIVYLKSINEIRFPSAYFQPGFARELIQARMIIYKYESAHRNQR